MRQVVQVVPYLPPAISGVGDYAMLLAIELHRSHNIHTRFIVSDPGWEGASELNGFPVTKLAIHTPAYLKDVLNNEAKNGLPVLLQYVGYGYEKRGCPSWLLHGIEKWKGQSKSNKLLIMFHELYATGPLWRSSFWLSLYQRQLVSQLAKLADSCITSMHRYAEWLSARAKKHYNKISSLPVLSNMGEMKTTNPLHLRSPNMVIFGGERWVKELLNNEQKSVLHCCHMLGLEEIITVGSPQGTAPTNLPIKVVERGFLAANQIAEIISSSRVGMMDYFSGYLAKSGVFAAYTALSVLPVLPRPNASDNDGCIAGRTYLHIDQLTSFTINERLQEIADNAFTWYQAHNLERTAELYAKRLNSLATKC